MSITNLPILANTDGFVIINKPAGIGFHDEDGDLGVFNLLQAQLQLPLYPVHRLDKLTSGILLVAKNKASCVALNQCFAEHQIEKYYLAISAQKPKKKQGLIKGDMQKARRGAWKLCSSNNNPALTQFFSQSLGEGKRLFLARPHTGKTHQIRVALKSLGAPILGDELYGADSSDRGYLHAYGVKFRLFDTDYQFLCPPDVGEIFQSSVCQQAIEAWQQPWSQPWPTIKK